MMSSESNDRCSMNQSFDPPKSLITNRVLVVWSGRPIHLRLLKMNTAPTFGGRFLVLIRRFSINPQAAETGIMDKIQT